MASPDDPAFPILDFARLVSQPGMSIKYTFFMHYLAAQITYRGSVALDAGDIAKVLELVDMSMAALDATQ